MLITIYFKDSSAILITLKYVVIILNYFSIYIYICYRHSTLVFEIYKNIIFRRLISLILMIFRFVMNIRSYMLNHLQFQFPSIFLKYVVSDIFFSAFPTQKVPGPLYYSLRIIYFMNCFKIM